MKKWLTRNIAEACTRILEKMSVLHNNEECMAFGGYMHEERMLRVCGKDRWHTDSHAYDVLVNQAWRPPHKIFVLAANYQHFNTWCRISGLDASDKNIIFLNSIRQLLGANIESDTFIYYETWMQHPEHRSLDNYIKSIRTA